MFLFKTPDVLRVPVNALVLHAEPLFILAPSTDVGTPGAVELPVQDDSHTLADSSA